jgi:hypothetical protein
MQVPQAAEVSVLAQASQIVRPYMDRKNPVGRRLRDLWAAVVATRDLGACDVVESEFLRLAAETGLTRDLGRTADSDLRHVIRSAIRDQNPFC